MAASGIFEFPLLIFSPILLEGQKKLARGHNHVIAHLKVRRLREYRISFFFLASRHGLLNSDPAAEHVRKRL